MVILNRMGMRRTSGQRSGSRSQYSSDGTSNNPSESPSIGFPWQLTSRYAALRGGASGSRSAGQSGPAATAPRHPDLSPPPHSRPQPTMMAGHPGSLRCRPASSFLWRYRRYLSLMRKVDRFGSCSRMWHCTRR